MRIQSYLRAGQAIAFAVIVITLLASAKSTSPVAAGSDSTVTWEPAHVVSTPSIKSFFPSIAVDSNNKLHIVYADDDGTSQDILYVNNVNGAYSTPKVILPNVGTCRGPFFKRVVGPNNSLHLVYWWPSKNKQIYYRQGTLNGALAIWSAPQLIS